jgi:hypothetical protein
MAATEPKTDVQTTIMTTPEVEKLAADVDDIYIDPGRERRVLWKVDAFMVPLLTLSFLSAYLDRSNIGNALIAGLPEDLGLSDQQVASMSLPWRH